MSDAHRAEIAKLEALYGEHPEGRIFTHLAEAYRKAGELDRARTVLLEGIERHPEYSSAHVVLGRVLADQDRTEDAEAEFRRVLELDSQNLVALRALGDLARGRGDDERALGYYNRLLDLEPRDADVREIVEALTTGAEPIAPAGEEPVELGGGSEFEETAWSLDEELVEDAPHADVAEEEDAGLEPVEGEGDFLAPLPGQELRGGEPAGAGESVGAGDPDEDEESAWPRSASPGVMTETIAQVYARQGLYERAAEVYRELVRERPGDEALRARLEEMERLAAEAEEGVGGAGSLAGEPDAGDELDALVLEEAPGPEPVELDEPSRLDEPSGLEASAESDEPSMLEGFEAASLDTTESSAEPLAGLEVDEVDPVTHLAADASEPTTEEDLSEELDVRDVPEPPEEMPWAAAPASEEPEGSEGSDEPEESEEPWAAAEPEQDPWAAPESEEDPWSAAPGGEVGAPWEEASASPDREAERPDVEEAERPGVEEREPADAGEREAGEPVPTESASVWTEAEWAGPESESPYAWAESETEEDTSPPIRDYLRSLLGWSGEGAGAVGGGAGPAAPAGSGGAEPAAEPAAEPGRERDEGGEADDDDLDMFRSWLESLKQ